MTIFVDGYNLIFAASKRMGGFDISEPEAAREKLLHMLAKFKSVRSDRIVVFFDGGQEAAHLPRRHFARGTEVIFSDADSDADSDIKNAVSHDDNPRSIRVISSDMGIRNFVKRYGVQVCKSRDFLDEMDEALREGALPADEPIEKYEGASADEKDYWLSVFGDDEGSDGQ